MKRNYDAMEAISYFDSKKMDRIVHFDLKGAPLRVEYLEKVITAVKSYGATGILLEWEDTFPYSGELSMIGSNGSSNTEGLYSLDEVKHIIQSFSSEDFKVIQLVQTMGHMEFVLKHPEFKDLREAPHSPSAICPKKQKAQLLVRMMVDQILEVQPDAEFIHIGVDEVWFMGKCEACKDHARMEMFGKYSLFLTHVRELALYIKRRRPTVSILLWDDMMRRMTHQALNHFELAMLVTPVVWDYGGAGLSVPPHVWELYQNVFPALWTASAYKGANGSSKMISPTTRYVANQQYWITEIKRLDTKFKFHGIILTGWSRYDHYATLCEILPVAMDSLAACLKTFKLPEGEQVADVLEAPLELYPFMRSESDRRSAEAEYVYIENETHDSWPFDELARAVAAYSVLRRECNDIIKGDGYRIHSWLNPWHVERGYTNPTQVQGMADTTRQYLQQLMKAKDTIENQLMPVIGKRSVEEWIGTFVVPIMNEISKLYHQADTAQARDAAVVPAILE